MPARILPPPIQQARSDQRQRDELLNALRDSVITLQSVGGATLFSTRFSINTFNCASPVEVVMDQIELPVAYPSFNFVFAGQAKCAAGSGFFYLRAGGGDRTVDGDLFATLTVPTVGYARQSSSGLYTNTNGYTRIKLTAIGGTAAALAVLKDHILVLN